MREIERTPRRRRRKILSAFRTLDYVQRVYQQIRAVSKSTFHFYPARRTSQWRSYGGGGVGDRSPLDFF